MARERALELLVLRQVLLRLWLRELELRRVLLQLRLRLRRRRCLRRGRAAVLSLLRLLRRLLRPRQRRRWFRACSESVGAGSQVGAGSC